MHTLDRWSRNLRVTLESLKTLAENYVGLVSITESIDYSTAQGKLFTQMLGSFAEYFSESLATHIKKCQSERARSGRHLGGIPFGYLSCWTGKDGNRVLTCDEEHPGGVHLVPDEAEAIKDLFKRYAAGGASTADLAIWMNGRGFRTRNTKTLPTFRGSEIAGPRFFTNASVRGILPNRFYAGSVRHGKNFLSGEHEAVVGTEVFESVQLMLAKNSGRSATIGRRNTRTYLLKGLARCADCGMNLWAQTYWSGKSYYREQRATRSHGECPAHGGSILCEIPDQQIGKWFSAIKLPTDWEDAVVRKIQVRDESSRILGERERINQRMRRLGLAFVDDLYDETEYRRLRQSLLSQLESLLIPEIDAAQAAGQLLSNLPQLWTGAKLSERHRMVTTVLDAVYVDLQNGGNIVSIKPKPAFTELLGDVVSKRTPTLNS